MAFREQFWAEFGPTWAPKGAKRGARWDPNRQQKRHQKQLKKTSILGGHPGGDDQGVVVVISLILDPHPLRGSSLRIQETEGWRIAGFTGQRVAKGLQGMVRLQGMERLQRCSFARLVAPKGPADLF